ncbi:MAG: phosphohistidine phosphatase SixA [Bacteroidetes bacterium]|nr:phosphohistidine phosphatase SixA [Bacteroidota bacterium]
MNLYLVRHAEAKHIGGSITTDAARPLTADGERAALMMGRFLGRVEPHVPLIACSPLLRATQTAALLGRGLDRPPVQETWEELSPGASHKALVARLAAAPGASMVVVGHQPDMTNVLAYLVADGAAEIAMKPAAMACISFVPGISSESARLHWLVTPELIRTLAPGI